MKWPLDSARGRATSAEAPTRSVGARVILVDGFAAAHLRRGERELILFAPEAEPRRSRTIRQVALALLELAAAREQGRQGMLIAEINGEPASTHPAADLFVAEGFATTAMGLQARIQGLRAKAKAQCRTKRRRPKRRTKQRLGLTHSRASFFIAFGLGP